MYFPYVVSKTRELRVSVPCRDLNSLKIISPSILESDFYYPSTLSFSI